MKIECQEGGKLAFFKSLYTEACATAEPLLNKLDQHYRQYKGSPEIDG